MQELTEAQPTKRKLAPAALLAGTAAAIIVCAMLVHSTAFGTPSITPPAAGSVSEVPSVTAAPDVPVSVPVATPTVFGWGGADSGAGADLSPLAGKDIVSIAGSMRATLFLTSDRKLFQATGDGVTDVTSTVSHPTAIAAGAYFTAVLNGDGTVSAFGEGFDNAGVIPGLSGVTAIAAGGGQLLALHSDGTVTTAGGAVGGQVAVPAGLAGVTAVAVGSGNFGAIVAGHVVTWGTDAGAQPASMAGAQIVSLVAGDRTFLALSSDGRAFGWGANYTPNGVLPAEISGRTDIVQVASSRTQDVLLTKGGEVLTVGDSNGSTMPTGLAPVRLIGAGASSAWALTGPSTAK